ncbi:GNAT family N-acetyltransferase [Microvirga mediterraneensis]|uniref:GNAT family N-acetyltransferase n=1 Tax=Microvirga mediterraneensis TaxID=2754695 RepID=A0A838BRR2_9HYPH|nr:GNAT family N-acetyltransferase [Microvirga mediterraneensis]MBA1158081.1 GNAT family N-acetyltransferase [Microvirga mediterraneensis]
MPWRPMMPEDLAQVQVLADTIHVDHPEDLEVLAERRRLYPQGCLMLVEDARAIGYALTHPWRLGEPPPLNEPLGKLPEAPTTFYIHDVALLPVARGKGYAVQAANRLIEHARAAGFDNLSLVAVNRSQAFWERVGFRVLARPGLETKLASYGPDAVLMVHDLASPIHDA